MRKVLLIIALGLVIGLSIGLTSCEEQQPPPRQKGTKVMQDILYFKDARTGLCFAYYWEERHAGGQCATGGPAITLVPCDAIPAALLVSVNETESTDHE